MRQHDLRQFMPARLAGRQRIGTFRGERVLVAAASIRINRSRVRKPRLDLVHRETRDATRRTCCAAPVADASDD